LREELAPFLPRQKLQFFSPSLLFFLNRNHTADTDKATSKDSETLDRPYLHITDDRLNICAYNSPPSQSPKPFAHSITDLLFIFGVFSTTKLTFFGDIF
jgi:hypothetical protein